jgi:hypothetical protein
MRDDDDIPLLTEVHVMPAEALAKSILVTPALIAEIADKLKPQIAVEVAAAMAAQQQTIENGLQHQLDQAFAEAKQNVQADAIALIDKTKADFATEIPRLMHLNADIIKADTEKILHTMCDQAANDASDKLAQQLPSLQQNLTTELEKSLQQLQESAVEQASQSLNIHLTSLAEALFDQHKENLGVELTAIYKSLTQHTQTELSLYLDSLQLQTQQQLEQKLSETLPTRYENLSAQLIATLKEDIVVLAATAKTDYLSSLSVELPAVEQALDRKVHQILDQEVPRIEQLLTDAIKSEVSNMLESVRLVSGFSQ